MKMRLLLPIVLVNSLCGGFIGAISMYEFLLHRTLDVVHAHQIQIEDSRGVTRVNLSADQNGNTSLRFFSPHSEEMMLIGLKEQKANPNAEIESTPVIELNTANKDSRLTALRLSANSKGSALIEFSDAQRDDTMLFGHFPLPTDLTAAKPMYEWGLNISREHGETGVGIVDALGLPVNYISPVPHSNRTVAQIPIKPK